MQKHRTARTIAHIIMVAAGLYLVVTIVGAILASNNGAAGLAWGTGWRGWLIIPLVITGVLGAVSLFVFGAVLLFISDIAANARAVRKHGLPVRRIVEKPATAPESSLVDAPAVADASRDESEVTLSRAPDEMETPEAVIPVLVLPMPEDEESIPTDTSWTGEAPDLPQVEIEVLPVEDAPLQPVANDAIQGEVSEPELVSTVSEIDLISANTEVLAAEARPLTTELELPRAELPERATDEREAESSDESELLQDELVSQTRAVEAEAPSELPGDEAPAFPSAVVEETPADEIVIPHLGAPAALPVQTLLEQTSAEAHLEEVSPEAEAETELPRVDLTSEPQRIEAEASGELSEQAQKEAADFAETPAIPVVDVAEFAADGIVIADLATPEVHEQAPDDRLFEAEAPVGMDDLMQMDMGLPDAAPSSAEAATPETTDLSAEDMEGSPFEAETEPVAPTLKPEEPGEDATAEAETDVIETGAAERAKTTSPAAEPAAVKLPPAPIAGQDELSALRALVAELSERLSRVESGTQGSTLRPSPTQDSTTDSASPLEASPNTEGAPGRLPGTDTAARIAAEMAATTPARRVAQRTAGPQPADPGEARSAVTEDDFSLITGIGPTYSQRLREQGIMTYADLADASYEVLDEVTKGNLERVLRQDWRGQARRFAQQRMPNPE